MSDQSLSTLSPGRIGHEITFIETLDQIGHHSERKQMALLESHLEQISLSAQSIHSLEYAAPQCDGAILISSDFHARRSSQMLY